MKITTSTSERLVLEHKPILLSLGLVCLILVFVGIGLASLEQSANPLKWLFSGFFIFAGGGIWFFCLVVFVKRLQFIFDRPNDQIIIRRRSILKHTEITHKLSRLIEVRIETSFSENGQTLYRPVLILSSKRSGKPSETSVPLHEYFTSGPGPEAMVDAVNRWLTRG